MTTPNLDATRHWWVESLAWFMFSIECHKGCDNVSHRCLETMWPQSWMQILWSPSWMGSLQGTTERADAHDPAVTKADNKIHKPFQETAILAQAACIDLHMTDSVTEHPAGGSNTQGCRSSGFLSQKVQDLKHLLGDDANTEEGKTILWEQKKLTLYQEALYHCHTPAGELEEV